MNEPQTTYVIGLDDAEWRLTSVFAPGSGGTWPGIEETYLSLVLHEELWQRLCVWLSRRLPDVFFSDRASQPALEEILKIEDAYLWEPGCLVRPADLIRQIALAGCIPIAPSLFKRAWSTPPECTTPLACEHLIDWLAKGPGLLLWWEGENE